MNSNRLLTSELHFLLIELYKTCSIKECAELLNQWHNVDLTVTQLKSYCSAHNIKSGRTGRFERGHSAYNQKLKGTGKLKGSHTSFKKGHKPANQVSIGSETITKDGYMKVKIAEPNQWAYKNRWVWEQHNPPLNDGEIVRFRDGDKLNCDIDNLFKVDRALNFALTRLGYNDAEPELKQTILILANLDVATNKRGKTL